MLRQRNHSIIRAGVRVGLLFVAMLAVAPAFCQRTGAGSNRKQRNVWSALRNEKPFVAGSLLMARCDQRTSICQEYLIQALQYHLKGLYTDELKITDLDHQKVILVDRNVDGFLYMLPLGSNTIFSAEGLLATVWISSDGEVSEKVYFLNGDSAKVVLYDGSRFNPQFIAASQCIPNPIALVDQSDQTGGTAHPTRTEIWEWNPEAKKFILRATVPVAQKFVALAKLQSEAKGE